MKIKRIAIFHMITDLDIGGAEIMLYKLLRGMDRDRFAPQVISLSDVGPIGEKISSLGIEVTPIELRGDIHKPWRFFRLLRYLRENQPDIVQTWMYHGDLIGGLAAKLAGNIPVVWNIRHSNFEEGSKLSTRLVRRVSAWLSKWMPARIIANAEVSAELHAQLGYARDKMVVIPNGFDLEEYQPDPEMRLSLRRDLGMEVDDILIGLVARYHPQKDHHTFVQAAGQIAEKISNVRFVLCGHRIKADNHELITWIGETGFRDRFHLLGRRDDIPRITAGLDIATSSASHGEAFPNIIGEAMACGVPCVVTDVGDSAHIVGDTGVVVPPRAPQALAKAWSTLLSLDVKERCHLGESARERIREHFSLEKITSQYEQLYADLIYRS